MYMNTIKIFLASSITELSADRISLGALIGKIADVYFDMGLHMSLIKCDDFDNSIAADGKQAEFDAEIRDSELCIFLFYKKVGEYTLHEFEVANESYRKTGKPKIVTYFKYDDSLDDATDAVKAHMRRLDDEKYFYNAYRNIDELKFGVFMQLKLLGYDDTRVYVENDRVGNLGWGIANTSNISIFARNPNLTALKERRAEAERRCEELKAKCAEAPDDEDLKEEYECAIRELDDARKSVLQTQYGIIDVVTVMLDSPREQLSDRQAEAFHALDVGDYDKALSILKDEDVFFTM